MLAARRKERVIGRSKILTVSISTKKGFNQSGAPEGRRPAAKEDGAFTIEERIRANHIGSPNLRVNNKCLVDLKTYGRRPRKFMRINITKRGAIKEVVDEICRPNVRET